MKNMRLSRITSNFNSLTLLVIAFTGLPATAAELGNKEQFALEMTMSSTMGASAGQAAVVKYFVGKNRIRMEASMGDMGAGGGSITVFEDDQIVMYMLVPQAKQYMKRVGTLDDYMDSGAGLIFGSPDDANHPCQADPETQCEKMGSETVLGRTTEKYSVQTMEDGIPTESLIWFDNELLFPLKVQGDEGMMEATSIELGSQPDELFEIPADFTEMTY